MRVLGFATAKDQIDWACVEGTDLDDANIVERKKVAAPSGSRPAQLAWVRREVLELLERHSPTRLAIREAEQPSGQGSLSIGRVEVQGVILATAAEAGVDCKQVYGATVRSVFGAKAEAEAAMEAVPALSSVPKTRRDPVVATLCGIVK